MPAESMAGLLQGGVIERSWIGGRMFGNAWLVNSQTGEGAWVGATHKVIRLYPLLLMPTLGPGAWCAPSHCGMRRVRRCCLQPACRACHEHRVQSPASSSTHQAA